ncbi:MAG: T9SS type A sorting domain-containing protein [candidate division KSB1 bacterium]|nr:T9SS type A sorting domain-containing protein [candidate division KSB1 bacterium]
MKLCFAVLLLLSVFPTAALAQGVAIGQRFDLTAELQLNHGTTGQFAQVFVPNYYQAPQDGKLMLVFHLHSASWAAEDVVYKAQANAVLFNIHLGALSSPYQNYFQDANKFRLILDKVKAVLQDHNIIANPVVDTLIVTSFSAGYAGVREIFKTPAYYDQINALALADGLHCNSDPALKEQQMKDFLRFARDARDGKKIFCLTHSAIPTSGYESTTQTANYLINGIGAQRVFVSAVDEIGLQQSACDTGKFHLKGYAGDTASDHMKHLYGLHLMLEQMIRILHQVTVGLNEHWIQPDCYFLVRNYPNPFNSITHFSYELPYSAPVHLKIFNAIGQLVAVLADDAQCSGAHIISWDGSRHNSGVYFYQLQWDGNIKSGRCVLIK